MPRYSHPSQTTGLFNKSTFMFLLSLGLLALVPAMANDLKAVFAENELTQSDSILVTEVMANGQQMTLFDWQSDKSLIPASLSKLATSLVALAVWGKEHRFETEFYRSEDTLWVKGFGDPFLVSEELDQIAIKLAEYDLTGIDIIAIDSSYFADVRVPGRSSVADPYNAPLNAVSANFNTAMLALVDNQISSAEPQTPLTPTALRVAKTLTLPEGGRPERVNLIDSFKAASNFGELLALKLEMNKVKVLANAKIPDRLERFYVHRNSHTMAQNIRGMMEYSNNFIANQLFLSLSGVSMRNNEAGAKDNSTNQGASFRASEKFVRKHLADIFGWRDFSLVEGAGLSRQNRLNAIQINDLLTSLQKVKFLFKDYSTQKASIQAKTGTLNGVRSFAGYIAKDERRFQFVFNFNRQVPYRYREHLLKKLTAAL